MIFSQAIATWLHKTIFKELNSVHKKPDTLVTADHNRGSTVDVALWTDSAAEPSGELDVLPDTGTSSAADAAVRWATPSWVVMVVSVRVCADVIKVCVLKIAVAMEMRSSDSVDTECENLNEIEEKQTYFTKLTTCHVKKSNVYLWKEEAKISFRIQLQNMSESTVKPAFHQSTVLNNPRIFNYFNSPCKCILLAFEDIGKQTFSLT